MQNYQRQREVAALIKAAEERAVWVDLMTLLDLVTKIYPGQTLSPLDRLRKHSSETPTDRERQKRYLRSFLERLETKEIPAKCTAEPPTESGPYAPVVWMPLHQQARRYHAARVLQLMHTKAKNK